jgi:hypothetical protein
MVKTGSHTAPQKYQDKKLFFPIFSKQMKPELAGSMNLCQRHRKTIHASPFKKLSIFEKFVFFSVSSCG